MKTNTDITQCPDCGRDMPAARLTIKVCRGVCFRCTRDITRHANMMANAVESVPMPSNNFGQSSYD